MRIIRQSYEILSDISNGIDMLKFIEKCGRVCYKSEDKITENSAENFVKSLIKSKHESVLEHQSITVKFTISRATSHQLVRHRIASYSQASQRYCNYSKGTFGSEVTFVLPYRYRNEDLSNPSAACLTWIYSMESAEHDYMMLISQDGNKPEDAREVLPNSTMTEVVVTANLREWRTIFKLRTDSVADGPIREIMTNLVKELKSKIPVVFDDILKEEKK